MEESINRRSAIKYVAAATASASLGFAGVALASEGKKETAKIDGGWQYKDLEYEKHIPTVVVKREGDVAEISVEVKHPQGESHHISSVKIYDADRLEITRCDFAPEASVPKAVFYLKVKAGTELIATSDCNLHGIWMKSFKA